MGGSLVGARLVPPRVLSFSSNSQSISQSLEGALPSPKNSQKWQKRKGTAGRVAMHHIPLMDVGVSADLVDAPGIAGAIANEMRLSLL